MNMVSFVRADSARQGRRLDTRRVSGRLARATTAAVAAGVLGIVPVALGTSPAYAASTPVDVRVLVLDDGQPMVGAIRARLASEGVPTTVIDLTNSSRATITAASLVGSDSTGRFGRYSGIVLPSESPAQLSADELAALARYEVDYGVREVNAYTWAHPGVGLNYASDPGYVGAVDGMQVNVSTNAGGGAFNYLSGSFKLDDIAPDVPESWGYLATPSATLPAGASFTPLVTATIPGTGTTGSLMGVYANAGREQLVVTFASNQHQTHYQVLSHGIVRWLTRGVSLSYARNWFSIHSDDQYMADSLWSIEGNCTYGATCDETQYPYDSPQATVRMTAEDVTYLVNWQNRNGVKVDLAYNGAGRDEFVAANGSDPQARAIQQNARQLRMINHTYSHPWLGCVQQVTTGDNWVCKTDANGTIQWAPRTQISTEITKNVWFGMLQGLTVYPDELVTGQHSGLKTLPQMTTDNPNLAPVLDSTGVKWIASDASREMEMRPVGRALTVPRYPMNVYYNTATKAEAVDEYNWFYTSRANGGSGYCEDRPDISTCIEPLNLTTGWDSYIVPQETRIALGHVVKNDPRPHYAHQSNMAKDRLLFPVLDGVVNQYKSTYATSTPLVNPRLREAGQALLDQQNWSRANGVTARINGTKLTIRNTSRATVRVPVTTAPGTRTSMGAVFGQAYGGETSGWLSLRVGQSTTMTLASDPGFGPKATTTEPAAQTATSTQTTFGTRTIQVQEATTTTEVQPAPLAEEAPRTTLSAPETQNTAVVAAP